MLVPFICEDCDNEKDFESSYPINQIWVKEMCSVFEMKLDDLRQELEIKIDHDCK